MISGKVETEVTAYPFYYQNSFLYGMAAGYHSPVVVSGSDGNAFAEKA